MATRRRPAPPQYPSGTPPYAAPVPSAPPRRVAPAPAPEPPSARRSFLAAVGRFLKRWTIPVIGGVTPVGLILINIAVWINDHLDTERWIIAVMAFFSGMILNTWWVLQMYRWVQQRWPHWGIVHERNQEMALVIGMSIVTLYSFLSAVACFVGLRNTQNLPNAFTLWWGIIQIAIPFGGKIYFEYAEKRAERRNVQAEGSFLARGASSTAASTPGSRFGRRGTPPPAPPAGPGMSPPAPPPPGGGYVPPSYLPPS